MQRHLLVRQESIQSSKLQGDVHYDSATFIGSSRTSFVIPMAQVHCRNRTWCWRIKVSGSLLRTMKNSESQMFVFLQDLTSFYPYYLCEHIKPRTKVVQKSRDNLKIKKNSFSSSISLQHSMQRQYWENWFLASMYRLYNVFNGSFLFYFTLLR